MAANKSILFSYDIKTSAILHALLDNNSYNNLFQIAVEFLLAAHNAKKQGDGGIDRAQFKNDVLRAIDIAIDDNLITHGEVH